MINRELIRLKVIQLSFSHYLNGSQKLDTAEKELFFSLSKAYELYIYMLDLIVEINRVAERAYETSINRYRRLKEGTPPSSKFINNLFVAQLQINRQLRDFVDNQKHTWANDEDFVRRIYKHILDTDTYQNYMAAGQSSYEEDRDLWRKLYKTVIMENEELEQLLEEKSLYWNDDRFIVDSFVLKTIRQFNPKEGADQQLLPEFRDDDDREFAKRLFRASLLGMENYRGIISLFLRNWDLNRLAYMDLIIMQTALAEIFTFPQIPISVSINEYVEIAKVYSTPRSAGYINGMLDAICRRQIEEGKLRKQMPQQQTLQEHSPEGLESMITTP